MTLNDWILQIGKIRPSRPPRPSFDDLRLGVPQQIERLLIVPLSREAEHGRPVVLASDAIDAGTLRITEVGAGNVPDLEAHNGGKEAVLIPEGETLWGGKQNRVVIHSVIVDAGTTVLLSVGCVERGRWRNQSRHFGSASMRVEPQIRWSTLKEVASSARYDQGRLWRQVAERLDKEKLRSRTQDYHEYLHLKEEAAEEILERWIPVRDQVGMLCLAGGRLLGIELAGHPATFEALSRRTLPSYVQAASDDDSTTTASSRTPEAWLERLRGATVRSAPGLGAGLDLEIAAAGLIGRGVWHDGRVAYLAAFADAE